MSIEYIKLASIAHLSSPGGGGSNETDNVKGDLKLGRESTYSGLPVGQTKIDWTLTETLQRNPLGLFLLSFLRRVVLQ